MIQELSRAAIIPHNFGEHTTYLGTKQLQGIQHGWMLKEPAESLRLKWTGKKKMQSLLCIAAFPYNTPFYMSAHQIFALHYLTDPKRKSRDLFLSQAVHRQESK